MENATKALIIAAAVLIAIILVAIGVNLLGATGDTTGQAGNVANQIENTTGTQANKVIDALKGFY